MNAPVTRRDAVLGITAAATLLAVPSILRAQSAGRVVVVGGGFGGAACARSLKRADATLQVTLIEPNTTFTSCPFSNEVIAGLRDIEAQQFGYDKLASEGLPNLFIPRRDHFLKVDSIPVLGSGKLDLRAIKRVAEETLSARRTDGGVKVS